MRRLASLPAVALVALLTVSGPASAQERQITVAAPAELAEIGFLRFILPRFSLKHGVRVVIVPPGAPADLSVVAGGGTGLPAFAGDGVTFRLIDSGTGDPAHVGRFTDWLTSTAGQAAIAGFEIDGKAPYGPPAATPAAAVARAFDGDAGAGATLSLGLCGRCHVVGEVNRMSGIGSTPSFGVLRTFPDWEARFTAFYVLKPHGAFTQVSDVTPPFPADRPSPISPIEMTLDDLDSIVAYVAQIEPADLGQPIRHQ